MTLDDTEELREGMIEIKSVARKDSADINESFKASKKKCCSIPKKYIISYKSSFKIWWDKLIICSVVYVTLTFPYHYAYDTYHESHEIHAPELMLDIIFVFDFILMFITSTKTKKGYETFD